MPSMPKRLGRIASGISDASGRRGQGNDARVVAAPHGPRSRWLLAAALAAPLVALAAFAASERADTLARAGRAAEVAAAATAAQLDGLLETLEVALGAVEAAWAAEGYDPAAPLARPALVSGDAATPSTTGLALFDEAGVLLASSRRALAPPPIPGTAPPDPERDYSRRPFFRSLVAAPQGGWYVGPPVPQSSGALAGLTVLPVARPVLDPEGRFRGVIAATISPAWLAETAGPPARAISPAGGGRVEVWHRDGTAVAAAGAAVRPADALAREVWPARAGGALSVVAVADRGEALRGWAWSLLVPVLGALPPMLLCLAFAARSAATAAAERAAALGRLAGGVAHGFNNLHQAALLGLDEVAGSPRLRPDERAALAEACESLARGAVLTASALAFAGRRSPCREPVDLGEALRRMEPMLRRGFGARARLRLDATPDGLVADLDPALLEVTVAHLVADARDALGREPGGAHGGEVRVALGVTRGPVGGRTAQHAAGGARAVLRVWAEGGAEGDGAAGTRRPEPSGAAGHPRGDDTWSAGAARFGGDWAFGLGPATGDETARGFAAAAGGTLSFASRGPGRPAEAVLTVPLMAIGGVGEVAAARRMRDAAAGLGAGGDAAAPRADRPRGGAVSSWPLQGSGDAPLAA